MIKPQRYAALSCSAFVLFGCSCGQESTTYTHYSLASQFNGRPVSEFFKSYGFPEARFESNDGAVTYWWDSTQYKVFRHQAAPVEYVSEKGSYEAVNDAGAGTERQYCKLRIRTDSEEIIRGIDVRVDTVGKWSNSRCSELFNQ